MKTMAAILLLLVATVAAGAFARDEGAGDVTGEMKINREKMVEMLDLILLDKGWDVIIEDAKTLIEHARVIRNVDPSQYAKGMPKSDYFPSYALHLESSSYNLKVVAENIEIERSTGAEKSTHLRPNAAVFFGQIVSMCVNCHDRFRER